MLGCSVPSRYIPVGVIVTTCFPVLFNGILNIPSGRETTALIVYGCLIFSTVFSITITPYDAVLNAHENMFFYSLVGIIDVFLKLAIAILISYSDYDRLLFYGVLMAGESWLLRFITKYYCDRTYSVCKALSLKEHDNGILKKMASFAGWNMLNICAGMISLYGMNIAINHFFGTLLNAALGIATQLQGVLMGVSGNMSKALTPVLVKKEGASQRQQMLPYWAIINWIIFRIIMCGVIHLYFAHKLICFSVIRWSRYVLIPCVASLACLSCVYWTIRPQLYNGLLLQLALIMAMFVISLPVYWYVALSREDRNVFASMIRNIKRPIR